MNISALLTSTGINIGLCILLLSLYSILRKQPSNVGVYFGRRLAQIRLRQRDPFCFDRLVPSANWIKKAWETTEEEILTSGGLDSVVFVRILIFSIRIFSIAAVICIFLVLPLNYFGQEMHHKLIPAESLDAPTLYLSEELVLLLIRKYLECYICRHEIYYVQGVRNYLTCSYAKYSIHNITFRLELVKVADKIYGVTHKNRVSNVNVVSKEDALDFIDHDHLWRLH